MEVLPTMWNPEIPTEAEKKTVTLCEVITASTALQVGTVLIDAPEAEIVLQHERECKKPSCIHKIAEAKLVYPKDRIETMPRETVIRAKRLGRDLFSPFARLISA
jgi:hypothetical protein